MTPLFERHHVRVDPGQTPQRIDIFLTNRWGHISRNRIQKAIQHQWLLVNQKPTKPAYLIKPNDEIRLFLPTPPPPESLIAENIPLDIVYEDEALLLVNKPAGMVVHPGHGNWQGTLANALAYYLQDTEGLAESRAGLVHRIDKGTSGLLLVAKTPQALTALGKQFYHHTIERTYYALVWGTPPTTGTIQRAVGRHPKDRRIMTTFPMDTQGKNAITHYTTQEVFPYVTLLQCKLETGRTHQIRVHMQHIGHPLFNDAAYGGGRIHKGPAAGKYKTFIHNCFQLLPRPALHAASLGFIHPATHKHMYFELPLPQDFQHVLTKWHRFQPNY